MARNIDNPGRGDCGFYAFAIGLVEHIQNGNTELLARWKEKDNSIADINFKNIDLSESRVKDSRSLYRLQMSLRNITADKLISNVDSAVAAQNESDEESNPIYGSESFGHFNELVLAIQAPTTTWLSKLFGGDTKALTRGSVDVHNDLRNSSAVQELAEIASDNIHRAKAKTPKLTFKRSEQIEQEESGRIFMQDVQSENSAIKGSINKVRKQGKWATHSELKELAEVLGVNLHVDNQPNGKITAGKATIYLENHSNVHWTTIVKTGPKLAATETPVIKATPESSSAKISKGLAAKVQKPISVSGPSSSSIPESVSSKKSNEDKNSLAIVKKRALSEKPDKVDTAKKAKPAIYTKKRSANDAHATKPRAKRMKQDYLSTSLVQSLLAKKDEIIQKADIIQNKLMDSDEALERKLQDEELSTALSSNRTNSSTFFSDEALAQTLQDEELATLLQANELRHFSI